MKQSDFIIVKVGFFYHWMGLIFQKKEEKRERE